MMFLLLLNRKKEGIDDPTNSGKSTSTISSSEYSASGVMCCATNAEGQECSQLYDYGINNSTNNLIIIYNNNNKPSNLC